MSIHHVVKVLKLFMVLQQKPKEKLKPKPTVITFSGQARHGKDTAVEILYEILTGYGKKVWRVNYTDYLKYVASQYLGWDGEKDEKGRTFLQQLGAKKVARCPTFWVDTVIRLAMVIGNGFDYILIGDCRFVHDIERWKEKGYTIVPVHVERLGFDNGLTEAQRNHVSENALSGYGFTVCLKAEELDGLEKEIQGKLVPII